MGRAARGSIPRLGAKNLFFSFFESYLHLSNRWEMAIYAYDVFMVDS
jgi:hypothetical protein